MIPAPVLPPAPIVIAAADRSSATGRDRLPARHVLGGRAVSDIPAEAVAAYQRAAAVIREANPECGLDWQYLAAIGRVETNHGSANGSHLSPTGQATPAIFGPTLTMPDTDAGVFDLDKRNDRAVGPMQFIPATWSAVGVDGNGDKRRDPQNISDAALGSGVYLCAADGDLTSVAGRASAAWSYNHSKPYGRLVEAIYQAYLHDTSPEAAVIAARMVAVDPVRSAHPTDAGDKGHGGNKDENGEKGSDGPGMTTGNSAASHWHAVGDGPKSPHQPATHPSTSPSTGPSQSPTQGSGQGSGSPPSPSTDPTEQPPRALDPSQEPSQGPSPSADPSPSASTDPSLDGQ